MPDFHLTISLSTLLILLAAVGAGALTVFAYRYTLPPVAGSLRVALMLLRGLGLFLLFFLLGEPILSLVFHRTEKPVLALLIDQSRSMTIRDRQGNRKEILLAALQSPALKKLQSTADLVYALFDEKTHVLQSFDDDSVSFHGEGTDIGGAIRQLKAEMSQRNLRGVLLFTDGNVTIGSSASYEAEELGVPVSAVGIGDTSIQQDLLVRKVLGNTITYVGTKVPVTATVRSAGFRNERVEVMLLEGGTVKDRKTIVLEPGIRQYEVPLYYTPDGDGMRKITVEVSQLPGELSTQNNRSSYYVKVLKNKMRVLLLAGAPSPDVAVFRQALNEDANIELRAFIERGGGQFYERAPTPQDFQDAECIVLIGYPAAASPTSVLQSLAGQLANGKGVLFVMSRTVDQRKLETLQAFLPFALPRRQGMETQTFFAVSEASRNNALFRSSPLPDVWSKLPPVFMLDEFVRAKPESEVLAAGRIQSALASNPLFISRRVNRAKSLALTCYGLWRWKTYAEGIPGAERLLENLVGNSIRWLVTREDEKPVQVRPTKEIFAGTDPIEFTAQVYDENYEPIDNAEVSLSVSQKGQTSQLTLTAVGNGRFEGALDPMPEGEYTYAARALSGGKELAEERGSFSVGGLNAEFQETRMNKAFLQQIAARTGGMYYDPADLGRLAADIPALLGFQSRDISLAQSSELWNRQWTLVVLVALFSLEWYLRKRHGML
jgi:hypothetical protein